MKKDETKIRKLSLNRETVVSLHMQSGIKAGLHTNHDCTVQPSDNTRCSRVTPR